MTLLVTVFAAVICTALWYKNAPESKMQLGVLCWLFWGASLMWTVDAIFEYAELRDAYFRPPIGELVNDLYLGLSVIALALVIWLVILLVKDPRGVVRAALRRKN